MRRLHHLSPFFLLFPFLLTAQMDSLLYKGIIANDVQQVQAAINAGANVNQEDNHGATPLMHAIYKADVPIARLLVKHGASTKVCGRLQREDGGFLGSLSLIAVHHNRMEQLKFLIEELKIPLDERDYNPKTGERNGWLAVKWAAQRGHRAAMDYLINQGADEYQISGYYFHWGEYENALRVFKAKVSKAEKEHGKDSQAYADALDNMYGFYTFTDVYDVALDYNQQILTILENLEKDNSDLYARALANRAMVFSKMGQNQQAIDYYQRALVLYGQSEGKETLAYAITLESIGLQYKRLAAYEKAGEYYHQAEHIFKKYEQRHRYAYTRNLNNIGMMYLAKKAYPKSLDYFKKSLAIRAQYFSNQRNYAAAVSNLGYLYNEMGELALAEETLIKALDLTQKRYGKNHSAYGTALFKLGRYYIQIGETKQALNYYNQALENHIAILGTQHPRTAMLYQDIGQTYFDHQQFLSALSNFEAGIQAAYIEKPNRENELNATNIFSKVLLISLLNKKAATLNEIYQLDNTQLDNLVDASRTYQKAAELVEQVRQGYTRQQDKLTFLETATTVYQNGALVNQVLYKITKNEALLAQTFGYLEKDQALILVESNLESVAKQFSDIPPIVLADIETIQRLKVSAEEYLFKEKNKGKKADSLKLAQYEQGLFVAKQQHDSIINFLEKQYPKYYQLKYDTKVASLESVQNYLPDSKTLLLEYMLSEKSLLIYAIGKEKVYVHQQTIDSTFFEQLDQFKQFLSNHELSLTQQQKLDRRKNYITAAHTFYQQLLLPVLSEFNSIEELIIIPDNQLNYLPFEALLSQLPQAPYNSYDQLDYVIKEHAVRYEYAATLLLQSAEKQTRSNQLFVGFAPSYQSTSTPLPIAAALNPSESPITETLTRGRENIQPLAYNQPEVQTISKIVGGKSIMGALATESTFKKEASDYRILHLAMHGLVDDENPNNSHLVFAAATNSEEDGYLHAYELYNMRLNADLAVLSACETGAGKLQKGEGVMSLTRAFKYAGVPNIMMSLWKAADANSKELMTYFYQNLQAGKNKSTALQSAKLQLLAAAKDNKEIAHPAYWANFVLIGDGDVVSLSTNHWVWLIAGLSLLMGCFFVFYVKR